MHVIHLSSVNAWDDLKIIGNGRHRAKVFSQAQAGWLFVKADDAVFGKRNAKDRITEAHAIIGENGYPFRARADETCAQALARAFTEKYTSNNENLVWGLDRSD